MLSQISDAELINHNREASIPLLLKRHSGIIHMYANNFPFKIIPIEDRIQACQIGFMMAIREFDTSRGTALTTFAVWKMRAELSRLKLDDYPWADGRPLEWDINMLSINAVIESRDPAENHIPVKLAGVNFSTEEELLMEANNPLAIQAITRLEQNDIEHLLANNTTGIKQRELEIFFHVHGLFGYDEYTQQEIATIMCISRQRVQQIADSVYHCIKHRILQQEDAKDYL